MGKSFKKILQKKMAKQVNSAQIIKSIYTYAIYHKH